MRYLFFFPFTLMIALATQLGHAQGSVASYNENNMPEEARIRMETVAKYKQLYDSLFKEKRYREIIDLARSADKYYLTKDAAFNLIATYYVLGDTVKSDSILYERLNAYHANPSVAVTMLNETQASILFYYGNPANRKKIYDWIIEHYQQENITDMAIGAKLIHLYINDQWIRKSTWKTQPKSSDSLFEAENRKNVDNVYDIYHETKRILSEKEIGSLYNGQFLLIAHDGEPAHRIYYLQLIKEAVVKGVCPSFRIIDFILRTEMMEKGQAEFLKTQDARIEELKAEYGVKDYVYNVF